jgi:tetratricopeptide (TPR) repeat protein
MDREQVPVMRNGQPKSRREKSPQGKSQRRRSRSTALWLAFACLSVSSGLASRAQTATPSQGATAPAQGAGFTPDAELLPAARRGMSQLLNGDVDGSIRTFQQIRREHPESPLGYLFEADATWWKIYLTTGNLVDPDVFDVVSKAASPYDNTFLSLAQQAIRLADARVHARQDPARSLLDEGMAYGLLARFYGLHDSDLPTARAGKKMRALLLRALQIDPNLTDAYLGVGIYNYFVDTLPEIVKLLKFVIGLPGGSREVGLQQLELAATKGDLVRGEAGFYLAKDFSRSNEQEYAKSLALFQELAKQYPDNPLWTLLEGSLQIRLGHRQPGQELYREAVQKSAALNTEEGRALHAQSQQALSRSGG